MQNEPASVYEKAIKKGPTANLQRLHKHNRQQPLPASHTSLAWGVTGACLYQSNTAMFTIVPTMLCQLPQFKDKWMPVFEEKTGMKVAVYETSGVHRAAGKKSVGCRWNESSAAELFTSDEKILGHKDVLQIKM